MKLHVKIPAFCLAFVLTIMTFAGCASKGGNNPPDDATVTDAPPTAEPRPLYTGRTAPTIEKAEDVEPTAESFSVSRAFSNNMVLQRDDYIRIWGTAKDQDGKIICAEFKGLKGSAVIKDGSWVITLDGTLEASAETGHNLRVYGAGTEKIFKNVLVGDVYMVIGQSNAAYVVANYLEDARKDDDYNKAFTQADITDDDNIRVIRNVVGDPTTGKDPTSTLADNVMHGRGWQKPKAVAMGTSAIGYFFAKQLIERTNNEIPIGIIECSAAGAVLAAFMSPEAAEACGIDAYDADKGGYYADSINGLQQSRIIYNQYINPFMHFTISGIVWYQGESDAPDSIADLYTDNFTTMIQDYRDKINQNYHDFPVYIMELPPEYPKPEGHKGTSWAYIDVGNVRTYMGNIPAQLPNAFIAASSDLWKNKEYWNNLHPYCKWPMATRAVDIAMPILYSSYADKDLEYTGAPTYSACVSAAAQEVTLRFVCTGDGLKTEGGSAIGFEVRVNGSWVVPDSVTVTGDTVTVSHGSDFDGVRYNGITSYSYPETANVSSSTGVPMAAFCWEAAAA